jgi:Molybdopterin oxidoreductase
VGGRGAGRFERVSWDDAYAFLVERLRAIAAEHGPEALAVYTGRGNFEFGLNEMFAPAGADRIVSQLGVVPVRLAQRDRGRVSLLRLLRHDRAAFLARRDLPWPGRGHRSRRPRSGLGGEPGHGFTAGEPGAAEAAAGEGRSCGRDRRRRSETARALHAEWVGIRPGTDGALALGRLQVLIGEGRYDRVFVERFTHGFAELAAYVAAFTPERVDAITGVPAETVRELARAVAAAAGCSILMYTGLEYSNSGVQSIRAVRVLRAIAGPLDARGGKLIRSAGQLRTYRNLTPAPAGGRQAIGAAEFPLFNEVRQKRTLPCCRGRFSTGSRTRCAG